MSFLLTVINHNKWQLVSLLSHNEATWIIKCPCSKRVSTLLLASVWSCFVIAWSHHHHCRHAADHHWLTPQMMIGSTHLTLQKLNMKLCFERYCRKHHHFVLSQHAAAHMPVHGLGRRLQLQIWAGAGCNEYNQRCQGGGGLPQRCCCCWRWLQSWGPALMWWCHSCCRAEDVARHWCHTTSWLYENT